MGKPSADDSMAIHELLYHFPYFIDTGQAERLGEIFTETAELLILDRAHHGRAEVTEWGHMRVAQDYQTVHTVSNVIITMTGPDQAEVSSYMTGWRLVGNGPMPTDPDGVGQFRDVVVREPDGEWRIAHRKFFPLGQMEIGPSTS